MKLSLLPLVAGLATASRVLVDPLADTPSGDKVSIVGLTSAGSGCPAGTVFGQLSSDFTTITLFYASFVAQAGPDTIASDYRKNCQVNVKIKYPQGYQFSVFKADYRGYALIPAGDTGTYKATYYFSGGSKPITSAVTLKGPYDGEYLMTAPFGVESTVWSPCGLEELLNINSEVRLSALNRVKPALLTGDLRDLEFKQKFYLQWQKCTKPKA